MKNPVNTAIQKSPLKPSVTLKSLELSKCFPVIRPSKNAILKLIISWSGCVCSTAQENFLDSYPNNEYWRVITHAIAAGENTFCFQEVIFYIASFCWSSVDSVCLL